LKESIVARWLSLSVLGLLLVLAGCGKKDPVGPKSVKVGGTVKLDGQPMKEGDLTLFNSLGFPPDKFAVKDGKFEGTAKVGKMRVEVRAYREPKKPATPIPSESKPTPENFLPERYNTESTLTTEVTEGGLAPADFDVKSR
jgi:hypothetical protein